TIGAYNPFRYKGYYYDTETSMYYCKSRYYVPEWGRFLTPDSIEYLDPSNINGMNLFSYCGNDPMNYKLRPISSSGTVISSLISIGGTSASIGGSSVGGNLGGIRNPSAPWWISTAVGAIPDFILGMKYLAASGMHSKFGYATSTRYMHPIMGGTWRWFGKSNSSFGTLAQGTFKQILTGDARAGFGAIAKSVGGVVGLNALVNFGFNLYENNWQVDSAMLVDTAIDTAIGVGSYYLAAGTMSLVSAGLLATGVALPGIVVVGGIVILSIGFEHVIRAISDY
ncbi:RHS repeat-associated core domain-containing protein, partial [Thomasclavelia cocleata]|uniref:RHS repeat-associated core domain-containing protein n=1 Tax=Thomasclavelia cocleata TaxID=69824 RepID=UPI002573034F